MKNKEEILQFVSELEQYTVECGIKKRVTDAIADVRQSMQEGISQDNLSELDRLVSYIAKQENEKPEETSISREEVQQKIKSYLEQCRNSNRLTAQEDRSGCQIFIQDARRDMQDYTNVDANFNDVMNEGRFCDAFYRIGQKYARQINQRMNQYAESADSNYHNMMEHTRNILQASGLNVVTQKEFYQKWDNHHEVVKKGCEEKISRINGGEEEIAGFGQKHVGEVTGIIKKQDRRRRTHKLMPLYILLICIVLFLGGKLLWGQLTKEPQEQTEEETKVDTQEMVRQEVVKFVKEKKEDSDEKSGGGISTVGVVLPCIILVLIVWYLYMRGVDKKYRTWVCSSVGGYLSAELENFWKEDLLNPRLDDKFQSLDEYMDKEYEKLIENVCGGVAERSKEDDRLDRLRELCSRWEIIKREG